MIGIRDFRKLTKEQMIAEYEKAIEEYETLENDYNEEIETNDELYSENSDLKGELEELNEEYKYQDGYLENRLKDIKFGTDLQGDIVDIVLNFAEEYGVRFEILDLPKTAKEVAKDLNQNIELANKIGDLLVIYFDE